MTLILLTLIVLSVFSPIYCIYKPPTFLISYFSYLNPSVLFHIPTPRSLIALTIDDAPSSHTLEILETLATAKVHATFFVIGAQVAGREAILAEIVRQGHELGNHALHDEPSRSLPPDVLAAQIQQVDDLIRAAYAAAGSDAAPPRYFRPGSGFFNRRLLDTVEGLGFKVVLGDIYPHDPQVPYWRVNAAHILSMLKSGGVIICHDRRSWTVPMLRKVLPEAKRKGWRIGSLSEVLREAESVGMAG